MRNNIVTVVFSGTRRIRTDKLWQYDYGQILRIVGLNDEGEYWHNEYWFPITNLQIVYGDEIIDYLVTVDTYTLCATGENEYPYYDASQ